MSFPRMSVHIGDYKRDTGHLRAAGHGAYFLLMMHYWSTGGLPDDDKQLATIACMTDREWKQIRPVMRAFFREAWRHKRIDKELVEAQSKYDKRVAAGRKGGNAKAEAKQSPSNAIAQNLAKPKQPITLTDKELDDGEDASARGAITSEAFSVSEKLFLLFGFDPEFVPPGWCGAPRWVQKCLNEGVPKDVILSSAEGVKGRKRDGPPDSFIYLEKPLARDWARQQTPLPTVKFNPEVIHETSARLNGVIAASDRLREKLAEFDKPAPEFEQPRQLCGGTGAAPIRAISKG